MKITSILSVVAGISAATFALGLVMGTFVVAAYTLISAASFALIIVSDYAPTPRGYAAGRLTANRELLPFAG